MTQLIVNDNRAIDLTLDAFTLGELRKALGTKDIVEILVSVESDEEATVKAVHVLSGSQEAFATFARCITGDRLPEAAAAVVGAVQDFFPTSKWSEIQRRCKQRREIEQQIEEVRPLLSSLETMPPAMRDAAMQAIAEMLQSSGSSKSASERSASGLAAILSNAASASPDSAESTPDNSHFVSYG